MAHRYAWAWCLLLCRCPACLFYSCSTRCSLERRIMHGAALLRQSPRSSPRTRQQPLTLAEEQAASALSQLEQRDVAAALRLSLQASWDSDEEASDAGSAAEADSSSSEEEEEKEAAAAAEEEREWTTNLHAIAVPLPRLRHVERRLPPDCTPFQLLQCFLPRSLMAEFAEHTNAAAPHGWRPTTAAELYAFLGAHLFMGIDRLPRTELYWSATFGHPLLTSLFSRDRFKQLLRFFRVVAPGEDAAGATRCRTCARSLTS